ncbi:MAG: ABC transporter substrate-binding protein [Chloroflexi bacterium]|nr:MAG: ABC transporter substrate-binding protein [Chloroflexota bacterium]
MSRGRSLPRARAAALVAAALLLAGCAAPAADASVSGRQIRVVAAENVWGSIAAQLGGEHVSVTSIVTDPGADPHEYSSTTADARAVATADYVILDGAGYDSWGQRLVDANATVSRTVLDIGALLGRKSGDNPHFWYSPDFVARVVDRISADYRRIDPAHGPAFSTLHGTFLATLHPYRDAVARIAQRFRDGKVAATEDVFVYLAAALRLDVITPPEFMQAVAEGNEPPARSVVEFHEQLQHRDVVLLVYNTQTVTAVTTNLVALALRTGIPVVGISESLQPPTATFQSWQVAQLTRLERALG